MHKTFTPSNKTDLPNPYLKLKNDNTKEPSEHTIRKILQFASNYRVQKIDDNQYIEMNLS